MITCENDNRGGTKMEVNHVLVVEDDKEIRQGVKIYLKSKGYEVIEAKDGIEGLEDRKSTRLNSSH